VLSRSLLLSAVVLSTATAVKHAPAVWRGPPQSLAVLDRETRDWGLKTSKTKPAVHAATRLTVIPSRSTDGTWPGQSMTLRE
jgi:hypothetical protein